MIVRQMRVRSNLVVQSAPVFRQAGSNRSPIARRRRGALREDRDTVYSLGRLALLTGVRQMEQFSLRWEHVDLGYGVLTLSNTKSGNVQYVRLNEEAKTLLQGFIPGNKSVWVFLSENPDTHVDQRNFNRCYVCPRSRKVDWEAYPGTACGIPYATRLAMSGATEGTIATLLRHRGTVLVRRYANLSPSHL
jgi:integrase